jgi:hypothetical protein
MYTLENIARSSTYGSIGIITGIDISYRMDGSKNVTVKFYDESSSYKCNISEIEGVELTDNILDKLNIKESTLLPEGNQWYNDFEKPKFVGNRDNISYFLVRKYIHTPVYRFCMAYTKYPSKEDEGRLFTIIDDVRYVHQLQNILKLIPMEKDIDFVNSLFFN